MPEPITDSTQNLSQTNTFTLEAIIGFSGQVTNSFIKHPNGIHTIYAMGANVLIRNEKQPHRQRILQGHSNLVTCLAVSKSGKYIASGQMTHMGYPTDIIIWDFETKKLHKRLTLQKERIAAVAFSPSDKYLASLGGEEDNSIVIWDIQSGNPLCGATASKDTSGPTKCLAYFNNDDCQLITAGYQVMRIWEIDEQNRKLRPNDCQLGQLKRVIQSITVDDHDEMMYCGTTTGDVLQVHLKTKLFKKSAPPKAKDFFSMGVSCVVLGPRNDSFYVGCGDGTVAGLNFQTLATQKSAKVEGKVSSLFFKDARNLIVSTEASNIYNLSLDSWTTQLISTCQNTKINSLIFPEGCSDLFATASDSDVRIWNLQTCQEALKIKVQNESCLSMVFKRDGSSLITGWSDGKIRGYGPESGRIQFTINDAHKGSITALAVTKPMNQEGEVKLISGGKEGEVRLWRISKQKQAMISSMKEHKGMITAIQLKKNQKECVTSSEDGSCIIWDLTRGVRNQVLFGTTFFKSVVYFPEESQILTCGTDHKVAYWEVFDGSLIREVEVSETDSLNALEMSRDGVYFIVGGTDKVLKVYRYEEATLVGSAIGHSTEITQVKLTPDQKHVISTSSDGSIFIWKFNLEIGTAMAALS